MKNPIQLKYLSPLLVTATPDEIMRTIRSSLRLGSLMRVAHVMSRIATGVKACVGVSMGKIQSSAREARRETQDNACSSEGAEMRWQ